MKKFGIPVVVAINRFGTDTDAEIAVVEKFCHELGVEVSLAEIFAKGGEGGTDLAEKVCRTIENNKADFRFLYDEKLPCRRRKLHHSGKQGYRRNRASGLHRYSYLRGKDTVQPFR